MSPSTPPDDGLTERQRDVLRLAQDGQSPTEIGKALSISSQGVHGHLKRLRAKGLLPAEPSAPPAAKPGTSRTTRNGATAVDPYAAIMAAVREIEQQRAGLEQRLEAIASERVALEREEAKIHESLSSLAAMQQAATGTPDAPAVEEPKS